MNEITKHGKERVDNRLKTYLELLERKPVASIRIVNKGHDNGIERHVIHKNRLVYIYNVNTNKFITVLYARNGQLRKYGLDPKDFDPFIYGLNEL